MERAKRPYEGSDAYEAGKKDAIKDLYDKLVKLDECFIITKDDIIGSDSSIFGKLPSIFIFLVISDMFISFFKNTPSIF